MGSSGIRSAGELLAGVKAELQRLRRGVGLDDTKKVREQRLLYELICGDRVSPEDGARTVREAVEVAIDRLGPELRKYALVDFNRDREYPGETLTKRQARLAGELGYVPDTIRRWSARALDAVADSLVSGRPGASRAAQAEAGQEVGGSEPPRPGDWQETLCAFWNLRSGVDVVCSEVPRAQLPDYASPDHRDYLYYARFADLDSLIYVGKRFIMALPSVDAQEFQPSRYDRRGNRTLLVLGGPAYNSLFSEYQDELDTFEFEPRESGHYDPFIMKVQERRQLHPRWTPARKLRTDVSVFVRLTSNSGHKVFLVAGCLTLGVLGAAMCFLHGEHGARNVRYIDGMVRDGDFVMVTEVGYTGPDRTPNMPDLSKAEPTFLLARPRGSAGSFEVVLGGQLRCHVDDGADGLDGLDASDDEEHQQGSRQELEQ